MQYSDFEPSKWRTILRKYGTFNDPYIYLQYSQLLFDMKKYRKAAEILKKVINVMPEDPTLIKKMAHVCKIAGLHAEAEEYYKRVTYLNPVRIRLIPICVSRSACSSLISRHLRMLPKFMVPPHVNNHREIKSPTKVISPLFATGDHNKRGDSCRTPCIRKL